MNLCLNWRFVSCSAHLTTLRLVPIVHSSIVHPYSSSQPVVRVPLVVHGSLLGGTPGNFSLLIYLRRHSSFKTFMFLSLNNFERFRLSNLQCATFFIIYLYLRDFTYFVIDFALYTHLVQHKSHILDAG